DFEEFKRYEEAELNSQLSSSQQIGECIKMAKFSVDNNCGIKTFSVRIETVYAKVRNYLRQKNAKNRNHRDQWGWKNYFRQIFGG
ncbi:MAG: hypothetical protein MUD10_04170, partial [Candidatus Pacebacteria bacterium]|nr:hypothetical protein [Candidatus Paceibacterota bacterium]